MTFLQNSTINRKSFRHRKVDNKKPLRIYTPGEINEDDCIPVSRAGIEIETGVEKEEEEEWHLVHALKVRTESMEKGATASGKATIPVPTSSRRISYYADVYQTHKWKKPSTYVKFSLPVEECIGCLYCMDEKDDIWLAEHKQKNHSTLTEDQFEEIMQHFENVAKNKPQLLAKKQIPTWQDCEAFLPESLNGLRSEAEIVHAHWRTKRWERMKQYQKAGPLMFEIKTQEGKDEEDHPWTCFRRRELKPIRRTRRTETASFDKLRKIRKDIHSGRHIMVNVTVREKTKKQKIELDRKIFEKECSVRELRKKLGIRNETSHEQPKRRKSSFATDLLGATKKQSIKLFKRDDEYPMTDITDFPYLIQRKPTAAAFFRKFDSLKPTDRNSISCTAFRSRFGRGGRRRRIIDRLDVFSYRRIRETNERYKYDSDGIEDVFSDDEMNQLDDEEDDRVEDFTENMIRFHLFKEEDYQNLGVYRRIQKEKQNSPTKQQSLDALTGNHIPAQNPQHTPLANSESRQNIEPRTILDSRFAARSNNTESRTTSQLANQDSRQKLDSDPRTSTDPRVNMTRTNISNVDPRTFIDPRTFNGVNRNQIASTESSTSRDPRLGSNPPSTPRISNDRTRLVANNLNISDPRAHNGLILRPTVAVNHRDNITPYRRPMPRNARLAEDSNGNTIGGVTNVVATPNGITSSLITGGSNNTSMPATSSLAKNHATTSAAQINSPARPSSSNGNTNVQGNGDGLTRTSSNPGMITNGTGQIVDPSKVFMTSSGHAKILMNGSGQMIDPSKIMVNTTGIINSNQLEAQKISNMVKQQQALNTSIQSTSAAAQQAMTPEQFSQITQLTDPEQQRIMQQILSLYKISNPVSTSNVGHQINNQRQSVGQTPRQNITVGSNVPSISLLPTGMVQSPSTSVMRQNNAVQPSGSSSSAKPVMPQNFALSNGFNISPTSGSSNVRQNIVQSNIQKLRHISQNVSIGANGLQNTNVSIGNNGLQTINVNPNGVNGSQQPFVHPGGIVNINNMGQSPMRTANINGRSYLLPGTNSIVQLNGANLRPNVLTGNGSAHLANMVLPANTAINVAQASNLANLNRHPLVNGAATPNLRQVSTNGAAIPNLRQLPNGAYINANVFANNGNFGTNLTQMRPQMIRIGPNGALLGGNQLLANGASMYDLMLPSQSPRQNNVSPASVSTSNGGNNSVGTPSPQPQTEQRTVR